MLMRDALSPICAHRAHKETSVRHRLVASKAAYDAAKAMKQPVDTSSVYGHTRVGVRACEIIRSVLQSLHPR